MNLSTLSDDELLNEVAVSSNPTDMELALAKKVIALKEESDRINDVFHKLASIVDPEL